MYDDALRRRIANDARLGMIMEDGERYKRSVSAMCSRADLLPEVHEGYLTMTDRRLLFYSDEADPLARPNLILEYGDVSRLERHRLPMNTALAILTMTDGKQWHIVTGRKSVKIMKRLVRRS